MWGSGPCSLRRASWWLCCIALPTRRYVPCPPQPCWPQSTSLMLWRWLLPHRSQQNPLNLAFLGWVLGAGLGSCQPQALRLCLSRGSVWGGHKKTDPKPAALPGEVGDEEEMAALEAGPPRALLHAVRGPGRCSDTASPSCSRRMSERCEELSLLLPDPTPSPTSAGTTRRCRPQERPS